MAEQDLASFVMPTEPVAGGDAGMDVLGADAGYAPPQVSSEGLLGFTGEPAGMAMAAPAPVPVQSPSGMAAFNQADDPFSGVPVKSGDDPYSGSVIPEMTALREWEDKHERELEETMRKEEMDKKERRAKAKAEIDEWYAEKKTNHDKKAKSNREEEATLTKAREDAMKPGANPWERIVDLIDTNAQANTTGDVKDTSRMRTLLISLKNNPPATAA